LSDFNKLSMAIGFSLTPADCVSFPSPARPERGGFGNEAGVRENHRVFTVAVHLFPAHNRHIPTLKDRSFLVSPLANLPQRKTLFLSSTFLWKKVEPKPLTAL
jgi:hypothetical protein